MRWRSVHTHSIRLASGDEALVTRVVRDDGSVGYGYSLEMDATASRRMAESPAAGPLPEEIQAAISSVRWLPA
jgi:hypothetical protein